MPKRSAIHDLLKVMARLRAPTGCPWDRVQTHQTLRRYAVEEVYELLDAIEAGDDHELKDELGDLLLQIVFHCQLARERGAFDFDQVARQQVVKLIRRHPHVFAKSKAKTVQQVWAQWEEIKRAEQKGAGRVRHSALDGIPKHLPALLRAEKLVKKARQAGLLDPSSVGPGTQVGRTELARKLFSLAEYAQSRGWSAESLLRAETRKRERALRGRERAIKRLDG